MALISQPWSTLAAGDPADAAQVKTFLDTIRTDYNGNITDANIAAAAAIAGSKIAALGIGTTQLADLGVTTAKIANLAVTTAKIAAAAVTDSIIDWTSVKALRVPHAVGYKVVWGQLSQAAAAAATQDFAITFTTHSTPAATAFGTIVANNLQVTAIAQGPNAADILLIQQKGAATTTTITFTVSRADGNPLNTGGTPIIVHFIAVGPV